MAFGFRFRITVPITTFTGNCSWSAVYVVDVDPNQDRNEYDLSPMNGITRFYSPCLTDWVALMDYGNAYLQNATVDFDPTPVRLLVFPSWVAHQAMPYVGQQDRMIISFNASVHGKAGRMQSLDAQPRDGQGRLS